MVLKFHGDAIVLSGSNGTKMKSEIIGKYYPFWWNITSGGLRKNHSYRTSIVELNAGTGEDFIEDTNETVLGSSGHALKLKLENNDTSNLIIILVEEDYDCFTHLQNVIKRRWPNLVLHRRGEILSNDDMTVILINEKLEVALNMIDSINLGNSIFFFDPLLFTPYSTIETVAKKRIKGIYRTGTEFIIFLFTSDWIHGRNSQGLEKLPNIEDAPNIDDSISVKKADELFGDSLWRDRVLRTQQYEKRLENMVEEYEKRLHKMFRYVLPLPFKPKEEQTYHIFFTSNYETGIKATRDLYVAETKNERYRPNNVTAYENFRVRHPELMNNLKGNRKPKEWKVLWNIIRDHEGGYCDKYSPDIAKDYEENERVRLLDWLANKGYLKMDYIAHWNDDVLDVYKVNWDYVNSTLKVAKPEKLKPINKK